MSSQLIRLKIPNINILELGNQNDQQTAKRFKDPFKPKQPGQAYKLRPTSASRKLSVRENNSGLSPKIAQCYAKTPSGDGKPAQSNQIKSFRPQSQLVLQTFGNSKMVKLIPKMQKDIKNYLKQQKAQQQNRMSELPLITERPHGFLGSYRAAKFKVSNKSPSSFTQNRRNSTPFRQQKQQVQYIQTFEMENSDYKIKPRSARSITPQPIISNQMKFPIKDFLNHKKKSKADQIDKFTKALIQEPSGKMTPQFQFEKNSEPSTEASSKLKVDISSSEELAQIFSRQKITHTTENKDIQYPLQISSLNQVSQQKTVEYKQLKQKLLKLATSDSENGFEISFSQDIESIQVTPQRSALKQPQQQKFCWDNLEDQDLNNLAFDH